MQRVLACAAALCLASATPMRDSFGPESCWGAAAACKVYEERAREAFGRRFKSLASRGSDLSIGIDFHTASFPGVDITGDVLLDRRLPGSCFNCVGQRVLIQALYFDGEDDVIVVGDEPHQTLVDPSYFDAYAHLDSVNRALGGAPYAVFHVLTAQAVPGAAFDLRVVFAMFEREFLRGIEGPEEEAHLQHELERLARAGAARYATVSEVVAAAGGGGGLPEDAEDEL